jgi:hypothetical protein
MLLNVELFPWDKQNEKELFWTYKVQKSYWTLNFLVGFSTICKHYHCSSFVLTKFRLARIDLIFEHEYYTHTHTYIPHYVLLVILKSSLLLHTGLFLFRFFIYITSVAWGQVWTQKCAVQKASVDVNISYY